MSLEIKRMNVVAVAVIIAYIRYIRCYSRQVCMFERAWRFPSLSHSLLIQHTITSDGWLIIAFHWLRCRFLECAHDKKMRQKAHGTAHLQQHWHTNGHAHAKETRWNESENAKKNTLFNWFLIAFGRQKKFNYNFHALEKSMPLHWRCIYTVWVAEKKNEDEKSSRENNKQIDDNKTIRNMTQINDEDF